VALSSSSDSKFSAPIDLRRVRQLFAAPQRIAESAFLRREIAARMHERLALVKITPQRVLDAGCGDGADLPLLKKRYGDALMIGLDASEPMLSIVKSKQQTALSSLNRFLAKWVPGKDSADGAGADLVCADFSQLPLQLNAVDLIWSNLALHWHPQPDRIFAEWRRALSVDGLLMFSCFGPDTFKELRDAFATVDQAAHVLPFVDMHDFGDMLVNAGFSTPVMDMEKITVTYDTVEKMLSDVRAWGGNPLLTRPHGLYGRIAWRRMIEQLNRLRGADGRMPLTFEVIYGHAFRPAPRVTSSGETIVRFDLPKK
jgi:malonyl-CoA O-methyltransferase